MSLWRAAAINTTADVGMGFAWEYGVHGQSAGSSFANGVAGAAFGSVLGYAGNDLFRMGRGALRGMRNAGSSSYGPSPQDFRQARNIIGARRAEAIGGGRFDIRMEHSNNDIDIIRFYHGTSKRNAEIIRQEGIDLQYGRANADFGAGFYVSTSYDTARWSASRRYDADDIEIVQFDVPNSALKSLSTLTFPSPNAEWSNFVAFNKFGNTSSAYSGQAYDIVTGPMFKRLKSTGEILYWEGRMQTSIHTSQAVNIFNRHIRRP